MDMISYIIALFFLIGLVIIIKEAIHGSRGR